MNPAHRFAQLGRQQLSMQEGIEMLQQIQRELGQDTAAADAWGFVAVMAQACAVPANIIVNSLPGSPAKKALDVFNHALRLYATSSAAQRRDWKGAGLPWAFEAVKQAVQHEMTKAGAKDLVPGVSILLGLAEDGLALIEAGQMVSDGSAEMRGLARRMQQRIADAQRRLMALGLERARAHDALQVWTRTA
jgi:hypothetical protein